MYRGHEQLLAPDYVLTSLRRSEQALSRSPLKEIIKLAFWSLGLLLPLWHSVDEYDMKLLARVRCCKTMSGEKQDGDPRHPAAAHLTVSAACINLEMSFRSVQSGARHGSRHGPVSDSPTSRPDQLKVT